MPLKKLEDIREAIKEKSDEEQELYERMEEDYKLFVGIKYKGGKGLTRIYTDNYPQNSGDKIIDIASKAKLTHRIPISKQNLQERRTISDTERAFGGMLDLANLRLRRRGDAPLQPQAAWYATVRGWIVLNPMIYKDKRKDGATTCMCDVWDRRWVRYEMGSDGLLWVAHLKFLSKRQVKAEYGIDVNPTDSMSFDDTAVAVSRSGTENRLVPVVNFFDREDNSIIIGDDFWKAPTPHEFDEGIPVIIRPVGATPYIASSELNNTVKNVGESWMANNRNMIDHINFMMSAMLTQVGKQVRGAYLLFDAEGKLVLDDNPGAEGINISLNASRDQKIEELVQLQMPPNYHEALQMLLSKEQEGSIANPVLGGMDRSLSGLALNEMEHNVRTVIDRRLESMSDVFEESAGMWIHQFKQKGLKPLELMVKNPEEKKQFELVDYTPEMVEEYRFKCEFEPDMARDEMQKWAIADIARRPGANGMPLCDDFYILEDIIKVEDPQLIDDRKTLQLVMDDPEFRIDKAIKDAILMEEFDIAQILAMRRAEMKNEKQKAMNPQGPTPGSIDTMGLGPDQFPPEQANPGMMQMLEDPRMSNTVNTLQNVQRG